MSLSIEYREASFKGVSFEVTSSDMEIGRRGALHEYVNEDIPYFEDMGKKARRFNVEAYLRGDDHLARARRLQRAIELEGAGQLVLPNRITENVISLSATRTENLKTSKLETVFSLEFIEAGKFQFPSGIFDSIGQLLSSVDAAVSGLLDDVASATATITGAVQYVSGVFGTIGESISALNFVGDDAAALASVITGVETNTPETIRGIVALTTYQEATPPIVASPRAIQAYEAARGFEAEFRTLAAIKAAGMVAGLEFTNRLEAVGIRDAVGDALVNDIEHFNSDKAKEVLEVRRRFFIDINARIITLPAFVHVDLGHSLPSVVAVHEIYGDWTKEADLRTWNKVVHPLFMPSKLDTLQ